MPTDAVEEYCRYLATALHTHDIQLEICRLPWEVHGWPEALQALRLQASKWYNSWVLVQYTALAWSRQGFPHKVIHVLKILKKAGARMGIVFHDVDPYPGTRVVDSVRRLAQVRTMRRALALADLAVFTVPPENVSWMSTTPSNAAFVPVGANLPILFSPPVQEQQDHVLTIGIFSITGGDSGAREARVIIAAIRHAAEKLGKLRLSVFGRHAELRKTVLRNGLRGLPVELSVEGVVEPAQVVQNLTACDLLLFIRGPISSRRSSAIAGIACGLPVIAYRGSETAAPITDAGLVLVSPDQANELNAALVRILSDGAYRMDLASRSRAAYEAHFAWPVIAARYKALLDSR